MISLAQMMPAGARGYLAAEGQAQEAGTRNLANIQQAAQIRGALEKLQLEQNMRSELAAADTPEKKEAVAIKYGGPTAILGHLDRQERVKQTKELALSRLSQTATQAEQTHQYRMATLTDARSRAEETQRHNSFMEALQAERLRYDTGANISPPARPAPMAPADPLAGRPQSEQDAIRMVLSGQATSAEATPQGARMVRGPQAIPIATAAPQPMPATDIAAVAPSTPATLSQAQSGGLEGRFPPVGAAAQPAPAGPVTPGAVIAPAQQEPVMPAIIANAPKRVQDKWKADQAKTSIAGAGNFTPETLKFTAQQYLAGDRQAVQGFARSAPARIALQEAIRTEAEAQGLSPQAVAAKIADFAGTMAGARTVGQRAANISLAATEAQEMISIVRETSEKFSRTNFVPWNMALRAYESGTGSPEIAEFGASLNALVNTYARAINPTGQPTVSDKEHAREVINTVQSPAQVKAVLNIINRELEIAKKAPQTVNRARTESLTGQPPAPNTAPTGGYSDPGKERRYQEWKAKQGG